MYRFLRKGKYMEASVIVGYHNEAGLVQLLLESIDESIRNRIEVILVDDASEATYDYSYDGEIKLIRLKERRGIGHAFDVGVWHARADNIILCGGDIVFKDKLWLDYFLADLIHDDEAIICGKCLNLHEHAWDINDPGLVEGYGARIIPFVTSEDVPNSPEDFKSVFQTRWLAKPLGEDSVVEVPCVLGGCYAIKKKWYEYLRGFEGHLYWGTLEPYISIKNWMFGGSNKVDTRIEHGHWFINKGSRFTVERWHIVYNKILVAFVLGGDLTPELVDSIKMISGHDVAAEKALKDVEKIRELRDYVEAFKVKSLSQYIAWQNSLIYKQGKSQ